MPDAKESKEEKISLIDLFSRRIFEFIWNNIINNIPGIKNLPGMGKITKVTRAVGRFQQEEIRKELKDEFAENRNKITELKQIEAEWNLLDKIVFKGTKENPPLVDIYRKIGVHTNLRTAELEARSFEGGTWELEIIIPEKEIKVITEDGKEEIIEPKLPKIKMKSEKLLWEKFGGSGFHEEDLFALGHAKINELREPVAILQESLVPFGTSHQPFVAARTSALNLVTALNTVLGDIQKIEKEHFEYFGEIKPEIERLAGIKQQVEQHRPDPNKIRFSHTYKVIAPVIRDPSTGKLRYINLEYPDFKREDEIEYGLDENGYPLEVDPNTGEVLLDKWWKEISEHPQKWHEEIIKSKQGGEEVWKVKADNGVRRYGVRKVDKSFITEIDILDMAMFIYNEWDAYRDDFRDGRYHPYSKSIMDYLIAAHNGVMPNKKMNIHFDPTKDYKTFMPIKKESLPKDEQQVTQVYTMRVFNTETNQFEDKDGIRRPTHLNPAFDRVDLYKGILHWGRMYYYETPDGINRWSENPFPHISSRGIAKYLIDSTIRKTYRFEDAREALRHPPTEYDYGRRHYTPDTGPYITDPLGEGGILG